MGLIQTKKLRIGVNHGKDWLSVRVKNDVEK